MDWGDRLNMFPNHRLWAGCLIALSLLLSSGLAHGDDALTILTEDYPPLNYVENKELKGPSVDIVRAIQEKLGRADKIADKISVYPWARAYRFLETRKNTALFSTARTSSRENQFKWVGPIAEKKIGMYAKRAREIKLDALEDTKDYLIGVQRDSVTMQYLDERGYENFDDSTSAEANLKKLMGERNDLWFASNATVAGTCERLNVNIEELELVLEIENTFIYIAFNNETPDSIIAAWQNAYDGLVQEGAVMNLFRTHDLIGLYPTTFDN